MNNDFIKALQNTLLNDNNEIIKQLNDNMSSYQKRIFNNMKNDEYFLENYSLSDLIFDFDSEFIEQLLSIELDLYLNECRKNGIENKRNG